LKLNCVLPTSTMALKLGIDPGSLGTVRLVARPVWVDPEIARPASTPAPSPRPTLQSASSVGGHTPSDGPPVSILTAVHDPASHARRDARLSGAQTLTAWEPCPVDDGSNPEVAFGLERHASSGPRVRLNRHETASEISADTHAALELATGQYIALRITTTPLPPDPLKQVAGKIGGQPDVAMRHSDEGIVADDQQIWLHLKPD
jgi:hypothetical protein